jgi:hypothetical protein
VQAQMKSQEQAFYFQNGCWLQADLPGWRQTDAPHWQVVKWLAGLQKPFPAAAGWPWAEARFEQARWQRVYQVF